VIAFVLLQTAPKRPGKGRCSTRKRLDGAARVEVLEHLGDGRHRVLFLQVSGPDWRVDSEAVFERRELYPQSCAVENDYFGALLGFLRGNGKPHPGDRPEPQQLALIAPDPSLFSEYIRAQLASEHGAAVADALIEGWQARGLGPDAARNVADLTTEEAIALGESLERRYE
jgi:hypothetical protein